MYTPYVRFSGILYTRHIRKFNYVKIKINYVKIKGIIFMHVIFTEYS